MSLCHQLFTYFSITLNNPDENDLLIVRNPNEKYIRQCIWTHETGKQGTPHVQMWIRLFRNNSLSLVKKLYPRAHIRGIAKDEYNENSHAYAQKDDETTRGAHVITTNDADKSADVVLYRVIEESISHIPANMPPKTTKEFELIRLLIRETELRWVRTKPYYEKVFTSAAYARLKDFLPATVHRIWTSLHTSSENLEQQTNNNAVESQEVSVPTIHTHAPAEEEDDYASACTSPSEDSD